MANGHGGRRPGAGRKPKDPDEYRGTMRALFETCVTKADWETVIFVALASAKTGDKAARDWLSPWIVGKVPDEVKHTGDPDEPIRVVVEVEYSDGTAKSNTD